MSSLHALREFISERLTAAAGEIFTVFEQTVLQYEEQIARQHKLLEISWNPRVKLHRTESPQQHTGHQKTSSGLEQEEREAPHIKEEHFDEVTATDGESHKTHNSMRDWTTQRLTAAAAAELQQHRDCGDEQLFTQATTFCLELEEPEPQQIKEESEEPGPSQMEEHEELGTSQEGGSDAFRVPSVEEQCGEPEEAPDTEHFLFHDSEVHHHLVHVKTHAGEKPYSCDRCGKSYKKNNHLIRHIRSHTGEKPYSCESCGKTFEKNCNLIRHIRSHTGAKQYCCETCGKSFEKNSHLVRHIRSHTGEKPYPCEMCGKGFSQHNHMLVHMRTHTGEKPHSCETCGRSFNNHSALLRHRRIHTGERPYTCEMCGRSFNRQNHLLVHIRLHTGEKPYSCGTCGKSFTHRPSLLNHMKYHEERRSHERLSGTSHSKSSA